ncbi:MAG: DUF4347 domain-containing protein, partial [Thiogranum sp.]|nr:DUF4347 domain-containing protein [Thiogranum sp.]
MSTQRKIHAGLPSRAASGFLFEELEPRLLLSADSPLNVADDYAPIAAPEQASLQEVLAAAYPSASVASVSGIRQELVFVDTDTPEYQQLLEDLLDNQDASRRFQVILLDNDSDGIAQITDALSEYRSLDGVHIISHGSDDSIDIGNTRFDIDALRANAAAVQAWGEAFSENGDFLIYGCNLAANSQGRALVDSLARLTGVDVAASDDLTGSAQIGADWDLEYSQGQIETLVAFSQSLQMTWENALATYTVTSTLDDGSPGTLRWAIEQANLNAGVDTVNFDINVGDANHYYYADDGIAGQVTHDGTHVLTTTASDDATIVGIDPDFAKSWYTISPTSMLSVTDTLVLDGTTQAGFVDTPIIELNGTIAGAAASGLHIESDNSTVRGLVINRFGEEGIQILMGNGNTIEGNYIGTDVSGTVDLGNIAQGISIVLSTDNVIGGSTAAQRNVISGNDQAGIIVWDVTTTGTVIQGNYIGVDASGTRALGNTDGIVVDFDSSNTIIGGDAAAGEGNLISGNSRNGIEIYDAGNNTVAGNRIGTDVTGTLDLGNARSGIAIGGYSTANIIGGLTAGESNVISGNDWSGIEITGTATGNAILRNSIYANTLLGIDLNADGVTANDVNDADTGPGNLQNFPLLTTAVTDGAASVVIDGTLSGTAGTSYRIDFFASNSADASGHGEGERYLGFVSVTTDGSGSATISASLTATVAAGESITATATVDNLDSTYGDTSEFSANLVAVPANAEPVTDDSSAAGNEDAVSISIALTGSDSDGSVEFFRLSNLPANGTLFTDAGLTTMAVTGADYAATTEALTLWFVPDSDWNGVTTFQYVAGDDGGAVDA